MKNLIKYITIPTATLLPYLALAAGFDQGGKLQTFFSGASNLISNTLIPLLMTLSFVLFLIGVVQFFFIADGDNAEGKKKGKTLMIWGIVAFVIIVSIWGIVALLSGGLGLGGQQLQGVPSSPTI